ncbi:MAG: ABC transporter ATP-binding protein [Elioraea sp.]|nr:ABC transporter ATP-binding protein [Elioraea sp.]MDW8444380.1 ABC transporter ATP-binding protein [Acetobacteraceae bacterium]
MPSPLLVVDRLTTELRRTMATILEEVSFAIGAGETVAIVGESGSGKSMLALTVMGLLPRAIRRTAGSVLLAGTDLTTLPPSEMRARRGRDLAMIFQEPLSALNPVMRVGTQITEVLTRRRGLDSRSARAEALRLLARVGIARPAERFRAYPHELSGGMRQRVMIAAALAAEPRLLIADEPTTALDVTVQAQILDLLRDLKRDHGLSLMLITHDLGVVAEVADRVVVLYAGRVAEIAPVEALFDAARHPYSQALLASRPRLHGPRGTLIPIDGSVPTAEAMPSGCRFRPRCPRAEPICASVPPLVAIGPDHLAACWLVR